MEQQTDLSSAAIAGSPRHSIRRSSRLQNGLVNMEPYLAQETTTTTPYVEQVEAPISIPPRRSSTRLQNGLVNMEPYLAQETTTTTPYVEQVDAPISIPPRRSIRLQNGLVNMEPYLAQETTTTTPYVEQVEAPISLPPRHSIRRASRAPVNVDPLLSQEMTTPTQYVEQAEAPAVSYLDQSPYLDEQQDSALTTPYLNQQLAPTDQASDEEQISNLIVVRYENTIRKFGIDASYEAIKEAIKTAFGIRSNRSFYLEDDEGIIWSIDRDMPTGTYNLTVDKGLTIKICVYDESDVPTGETEERTFYLDEDFRDFLNRRRWSALREVGGFEDVECLSELVEMGVYQRAGHTRR